MKKTFKISIILISTMFFGFYNYPDDLMDLYSKFIKEKNISEVLAGSLYRSLNSKSKYEEALKVLEYLIQKNPNEIEYYNQTASIYLHGVIEPEKAFYYLNKSIAVDSNQIERPICIWEIFIFKEMNMKVLKVII